MPWVPITKIALLLVLLMFVWMFFTLASGIVAKRVGECNSIDEVRSLRKTVVVRHFALDLVLLSIVLVYALLNGVSLGLAIFGASCFSIMRLGDLIVWLWMCRRAIRLLHRKSDIVG